MNTRTPAAFASAMLLILGFGPSSAHAFVGMQAGWPRWGAGRQLPDGHHRAR